MEWRRISPVSTPLLTVSAHLPIACLRGVVDGHGVLMESTGALPRSATLTSPAPSLVVGSTENCYYDSAIDAAFAGSLWIPAAAAAREWGHSTMIVVDQPPRGTR